MAPPEREESIRCPRLLRDLCGGAACHGLIRSALAAPHLAHRLRIRVSDYGGLAALMR
jgi:hypothetical protein